MIRNYGRCKGGKFLNQPTLSNITTGLLKTWAKGNLTSKNFHLKISVMKGIKMAIATIAMGIWAAHLGAQSMTFAYTFGKNQNEYGYGIMEVADGYVIVGNALLGGGGKADAVALKINTDGSFGWYRTYGKNDDDVLRFPFVANDGNFIHFGYTQTNAGKRPISVKTQPNGNLIWTKTYGIVGEFLDVIKETNGFVAVGYDFLGRGIFVKMDNDGDINLMKTYSQGSFYGVYPDGYGGYVVVGQKNGEGWVLRVDQDGEVIWSKTYGGTNLDILTDVFVSGNTIFAGGKTQSVGAGNWDVWILKLNLMDGSVAFSKTYGGLAEDELRSFMPNGSKVRILAYTRSWGMGAEFWVFDIDGDGNILYSATYGGDGDDFPYMGITTTDGGYILIGASQTAAFSQGGYDYFVVKISLSGYSCIKSFEVAPTLTYFNPTISSTSESPSSSTPPNSDPNFTSTSPYLNYTVVCAPLGGDDELSVFESERALYSINVYGNKMIIKAEGRKIEVFSVDGRLKMSFFDEVEIVLPKGVYKVRVGKDVHTVLIR